MSDTALRRVWISMAPEGNTLFGINMRSSLKKAPRRIQRHEFPNRMDPTETEQHESIQYFEREDLEKIRDAIIRFLDDHDNPKW